MAECALLPLNLMIIVTDIYLMRLSVRCSPLAVDVHSVISKGY